MILFVHVSNLEKKGTFLMAVSPVRGVTIFYCYAPEDEKHLRELEKHMGALKRLGKVTTWHDRHIMPGMDWEAEIEAHLNAADIILLLISPDFVQSDYCYNVEMRRALDRHHSPDKTEVIPIILRPVNWLDLPIRLCRHGRPGESQLLCGITAMWPIRTWSKALDRSSVRYSPFSGKMRLAPTICSAPTKTLCTRMTKPCG